jgi:hypothetical protein
MEHNLHYLNQETSDKYLKMMEHTFLWPGWEPSVETVENGTIVPAEAFFDEAGSYKYRGGVLDAEGQFVKSSGLYKGLNCGKLPLTMAECSSANAECCDYIDETVVYYGLFIYHWGHFLFESTTRLWYYLRENCKAQGMRLFGVHLNQKPDKNFQIFHEMLGIGDADLVFLDHPTRFKRIIIPNVSCMLSTAHNMNFYYSKEFMIPFDIIRDTVKAAPSKNIYLTRTKLKNSNTIGEEAIEDNFRKNGFEILAPENLSLPALVSLLKGAQTVAGLSGSNTHNLLFAGSGCRAIILNRLQGTNYPQELVHQARDICAVYIDVYSTFLPVTHGFGPFLVSVNDHLFNYQVTAGMLPYNYSPELSPESIVRFLRAWASVHQNNTYAAAALLDYMNAYHLGLRELIERIGSFFTRAKHIAKHKPVSKRCDWLLWLHCSGLKKIYTMVDSDKSSLPDLDVIHYSFYFNARWYRKRYLSGIKQTDPAAHYLYTGYKTGCDPSPRFSTEGYLSFYPDIRECGMNPLWHFEKHGKIEGRKVVKKSGEPRL